MPYAQKNHADIQGIKGKYKISQIGCFLTAYCNLLERFGRGVPPPALNAAYRDNGWFIDVDDGIRDDLNFYLINKYDPHIVVEQEGPRSSNMPSHRNAIVRIAAGNKWGTHFCLVDRIEGGVVWIVDSWDGTIKKASAYGPIQGWATYKDTKPKVTNPPQGGDEMIATREEAEKAYKMLRPNGSASEPEIAGTAGKRSYRQFVNDAAGEIRNRDEEIAGWRHQAGRVPELERALEAERNKPPKEVIKEVEKIVEKPVEKIVEKEVIKEVPKVVLPNAVELPKHYTLGDLVQASLTKLFGGKKG